jgi:hypothetical protein
MLPVHVDWKLRVVRDGLSLHEVSSLVMFGIPSACKLLRLQRLGPINPKYASGAIERSSCRKTAHWVSPL